MMDNNYPLYHYSYYYHQPTIWDYLRYDDFFQFFSLLIILAFCLFVYLLGKFFYGKDAESRYKILRSVVVFSPIWLPVLLFILIISLPLIREGNLFILSFILLIPFFFLYLYYLISAYPANSAYILINILNDIFTNKTKAKVFTIWSILEKLKRQRLFFLSFLNILLFLIVFFNIYLFSQYLIIHNYGALFSLLVLSLTILIVYLVLEITNYGKVNIPQTEHKKAINLKRIIETLSVRTGIALPQFKILAFNNPTIFSTYPNFGEPTIYITAPLLNMADDSELEALISHEFAQMFSGRLLYFKRVHNILIVLRIFAFSLFFLFLLNINPFLIIWWYVLISYSGLNIIEQAGKRKLFIEIGFKLFNPPLAIINFLSYCLYYAIARNEEFYADMKTIEFTRYPKGIYSILQKLRNYTGPRERLPRRFNYLYFSAEDAVFDEIPMPQPVIEERKEIIEGTDQLLTASKELQKGEIIKCPNCDELMELLMMKGAYENPLRAKYCKRCKLFWLEGVTFWCVFDYWADEPILKETVEKEIKLKEELLCPRCGVNLLLLEEKNPPFLFKDESFLLDIKIWSCYICNSYLINQKDFLQYLEYKKRIIEKK